MQPLEPVFCVFYQRYHFWPKSFDCLRHSCPHLLISFAGPWDSMMVPQSCSRLAFVLPTATIDAAKISPLWLEKPGSPGSIGPGSLPVPKAGPSPPEPLLHLPLSSSLLCASHIPYRETTVPCSPSAQSHPNLPVPQQALSSGKVWTMARSLSIAQFACF